MLLVLDDYHLIQNQAVHDAVAFLLEHCPPNLHIAIATRADPPLPVALLRGREQLTELRQADLCFTPEEVGEFLETRLGFPLSTQDILSLESQTEGWITALQLLVLSTKDRQDFQDFIATFSGSHRYIVDYLIEQVLRKQPEPVRQFLLGTSILDRFSAPLCDAVMPQSGILNSSEAMLEQLERANLFIIPLDDRRHWYRYHHLFADLLRSQLDAMHPGWAVELHLRASQWYEDEGLISEAFEHALAAGQIERAASLLEKNGAWMIRRGEISTTLRWLNSLPDKIVRSIPHLSLYYAWVLYLTGQAGDIEARLQDTERGLALNTAGRSDEWIAARSAEIILIRAGVAANAGNASLAVSLSRQALEQIPQDGLVRGLFYNHIANAAIQSGDLIQAIEALNEAVRACQADKAYQPAMQIAFRLVELQIIHGKLHQAAEICHSFLQQQDAANRPDYRRMPAMGPVYIGQASLLYERDELEAAAETLRDGLLLNELSGVPYMQVAGTLLDARVKQAQGDPQGALEAIDKAEQIQPSPRVKAHRARLMLAQGNLAEAARWVQECGLTVEDTPAYSNEFNLITLARVLLAQEKFAQAEDFLARLAQYAGSAGRVGRLIEVSILRAEALERLGQSSSATTIFGRALQLAEAEGYRRVFIDEGGKVRGLLKRARLEQDDPALGAFMDELLGALPLKAEATGNLPVKPPAALVEPLSEREMEILRILPSSWCGAEMAAELSISFNTLRTHLKNVYAKLGVHSRAAAIARARDLHIL